MLRENEYFGNQHIQPLIEDLAEEWFSTGRLLWMTGHFKYLMRNIQSHRKHVDSQKTIKDIANKVEYELKKDREALLKGKKRVK